MGTKREIVIHIDQSTGAICVKGEDGEELEVVGDLYSSNPDVADHVREVRDDFEKKFDNQVRYISVPLELWESKGNSVCYIKIGGVVRRKPC